jgi:hypothetical protein
MMFTSIRYFLAFAIFWALPALAANTISATGGNNQTQVVTTSMNLQATVVDDSLNPVSGITVNWAVTGVATLSALSSVTNGSGVATITLTLGIAPGPISVKATIAATTVFTTFTEKAIPGITAIHDGNFQNAPANTVAAAPLRVKVKDGFGNAVAGAKVSWAVTAGGGMVSAAMSVTDGSGIAQVNHTVGKLVGVNQVKAWVFGPATAPALATVFTTNTLPSTSALVTLVSGSLQAGVVGTTLALPLKVTVRDAHNNLVPNAQVDWTTTVNASCPGAGFVGAASSVTGNSGPNLGVATMTYRLGTGAGANCINATANGTAATVQFKATGTADIAKKLELVAGSTVGTVGLPLPAPLKVKAVDQYGNPVAAKTILWTGTCTDTTTTPSLSCGSYTPISSVTGLDGTTTTALKLGSIGQNITARATVSATAIFLDMLISAVPAAPTKITITSGNNQTKTVNLPLDNPLVVTVADALNNPSPNVVVAWTVTKGNGTVTNAFSNTNASGIAQMTFTSGKLAGTGANNISAKIQGLATSVLFVSNGTPDVPAFLAKLSTGSGDLQKGGVGTKLLLPLKAIVLDQFANPITGATVDWTTSAGDGSFFDAVTPTTPATSSLSAATGVAAIVYGLGTTLGLNTVTGTVNGTAVTTTFAETGTPGAPDAITVVSGNTQTNDAGLVLALPTKVLVVDANANPIPDVQINWTATNATVSALSTKTDALGTTQINVMLGSNSGAATVVATVNGLPAKTVTFTQTARPAIDQITPTSGAIGDKVNILGAGFMPGTTVAFDASGTPVAATCSIVSAKQLSCVVPPHANGIVDVTVTSNTVTSLPEAFTYTSPGAALTIAVGSGNGQTGVIGSTTGSPLVANVKDAGNNNIPGLQVSWLATVGGGTLNGDTTGFANTTSTTNGSGNAQVTLTYGTKAGPNSVLAYLAGTLVAPAMFSATATANIPGGIATLSGDLQIGVVHSLLAFPLTVRVSDASGNPVGAGVNIDWTVLTGAGTLDDGLGNTSATTLQTATNASGIATMQLQLGDIVGANFVSATVNATAFSTTFGAVAIAGPPASITVTGGNHQAGAPLSPLPVALSVTVKDQYSNVVPGVPIAWTLAMTPASAAISTVAVPFGATDGAGVGTNAVTLSATAGANTRITARAIGGTDPAVTMDAYSRGWMTMSSASAPSARTGYAAVWATDKMILWGGCGGLFSQNVTGVTLDGNCSSNMLSDGATYDPFTDSWDDLSGASGTPPSGRVGAITAWTGTAMIIWGGNSGTNAVAAGKLFNPSGAGAWTNITTTGEPGARMYANAVWNPDDGVLFGWGGRNDSGLIASNKGFRYSPGGGWTTTPWGTGSATTAAELTARQNANVFYWKKDASNKYIIVWGGDSGTGTTYMDGMKYHTGTDTVTAIKAITVDIPGFVARKFPEVIFTGTHMIVRGGRQANGTLLQDGASYNPDTDTWAAIAAPAAFTGRMFEFAMWLTDAQKFLVLAGAKQPDGLGIDINDYGLFTPGGAGTWAVRTGAWTGKPVPLQGQITADGHGLFVTPVSTGARAIVWGGMDEVGNAFGSGGIFIP